MADVLLLQDEEPAFRLAAWVLREESLDVQIIGRAEEAAVAYPHSPPDLIIVNTNARVRQERSWIEMLRAIGDGGCPVLHISLDRDHTPADCGADACVLPPHRGDQIVAAAQALLSA